MTVDSNFKIGDVVEFIEDYDLKGTNLLGRRGMVVGEAQGCPVVAFDDDISTGAIDHLWIFLYLEHKAKVLYNKLPKEGDYIGLEGERADYFRADVDFGEVTDISYSERRTWIYAEFIGKKDGLKRILGFKLGDMDYYLFKKNPPGSAKAFTVYTDHGPVELNYTLKESLPRHRFWHGIPPRGKNGRKTDPESLSKLEHALSRLKQTKEMYCKDGKYTVERQAVHNEIISKMLKGAECINRHKPVAVLTGGIPGAGKTYFLSKYAPYLNSDKVFHIDADKVRAMLPEYEGWNADQTHKETQDIIKQLLFDIGLPCKTDVVYDGTMNRADKYDELIKRLKLLGYKVYVIFVDIDFEEAKKRALKRYHGRRGRYVPYSVIKKAADAGLNAFIQILLEGLVDGWMLVNGESGKKDVTTKGGEKIPRTRFYHIKENPPVCSKCENTILVKVGKSNPRGTDVYKCPMCDSAYRGNPPHDIIKEWRFDPVSKLGGKPYYLRVVKKGDDYLVVFQQEGHKETDFRPITHGQPFDSEEEAIGAVERWAKTAMHKDFPWFNKTNPPKEKTIKWCPECGGGFEVLEDGGFNSYHPDGQFYRYWLPHGISADVVKSGRCPVDKTTLVDTKPNPKTDARTNWSDAWVVTGKGKPKYLSRVLITDKPANAIEKVVERANTGVLGGLPIKTTYYNDKGIKGYEIKVPISALPKDPDLGFEKCEELSAEIEKLLEYKSKEHVFAPR